MRVANLALCLLASGIASQASSAQPSASPSFMDPDYRPSVAATLEDVVGHYTQSGDPQVDVWFAADGTARIVFTNPPDPEGRFGSRHEYAGTWKIRNGWVDLEFDFGQVVFEFVPAASPDQRSTLTAKHSLRSLLLLRFQTLSRVPS
jgi:hypothetical protein